MTQMAPHGFQNYEKNNTNELCYNICGEFGRDNGFNVCRVRNGLMKNVVEKDTQKDYICYFCLK
jgi:hypothetical protein